jgi:hypothetical protein
MAINSDIKAIIDFGSSGVKGIINERAFYLNSGISEYPENQYEPNNWIEVNGKKYYLGDPSGKLYLVDAKHQFSLIKGLGFLASSISQLIAAEKLEKKRSYSLSLGCFLPIGESNLKDAFMDKIESELKEINSGWGKYRFRLKNIKVQPEGGGLLKVLKKDYGSLSKAILMLGFRNASLLIDSNAKIKFISSNLGFSNVLAEIRNTMGYPDDAFHRYQLMKLKPNKMSKPFVDHLLKSSPGVFRDSELELLQQTVKQEHQKYLEDVVYFLKQNLNNVNVQHLCLSGGTAYFFKEELTSLLSEYQKRMVWQSKSIKLPENFNLPEKDMDMGFCNDYPHINLYRWLDSYYFYTLMA